MGGGVAAKDDQISNAYLEAPKRSIAAKDPEFPFCFLSTIGLSIIIPNLKSLLLSTSVYFSGEQCFPKDRLSIFSPCASFHSKVKCVGLIM